MNKFREAHLEDVGEGVTAAVGVTVEQEFEN